MSPLVSIVIPCYNDKLFIEQSVSSALKQTYENKEIIIVDDGSDDKTKLVLSKLISPGVKVITQDNKGQSTARNVGIEEAKGEYILVLDSDDFIDFSFCEKAIKKLMSQKEVMLVSCFARLLYEDGRFGSYYPKGGTIAEFRFANEALGCTAMFRKSDWRNCGGYDENMVKGFEDWEFYIRLLKNGGKAEIIEEYLCNYRQRKISTSTKALEKRYVLLEYIYVKHKELYFNDFEVFVKHVLDRCSYWENRNSKMKESIEFKIGKAILLPLRKVREILS